MKIPVLSVCALASLCLVAADEVSLITEKRLRDLAQVADPTWFDDIPTWLASQRGDGTWADVNYDSGCAAQRANWPIQQHWNRLSTFAAAWSGANPAGPANWTGSDELFSAVQRGLDYWFDNDYTEPDCMGNGGKSTGSCPCGTPGLWNSNWFGQAILIPQLCSTTCLLAWKGDLSDSQRAGCERIPLRPYLQRDQSFGTGGFMTGANMVAIMQNSVSLALYTNNSTMLRDAFDRAMGEIIFVTKPTQDGIHEDGSFLQHDGILYNGNYGKDLLNAFIQLEGEAIGTSFAANDTTRAAVAAQVRGSEWMVVTDVKTGRERWDLNTVGRFVSFPTVDLQANADINLNVSKLATATADFAGASNVNDTVRRLLSNGTDKLVGNRAFWASDYMVHRRPSFTLTTKMLSTRSVNSESINGANPYGYHLGQGTLFSYRTGDEYTDMTAAWDWNLIPGTTVLLNRPELQASTVEVPGQRDFVGVVSDGHVGTAVEDYVDPLDGSISYQKAWFFLDDSVLVTTSNMAVNSSSQPITVLDNRRGGAGRAWVNGRKLPPGHRSDVSARTLYYGGNGYLSYGPDFNLTLSDGPRTGNWSEVSTSAAGLATVPIFSAYTEIPRDTYTYAMFPATSRRRLEREAKTPSAVPVSHNGVDGVAGSGRLSLVFWPGRGSEIAISLRNMGWAESGVVHVTSYQPGVYLFSGRRIGHGKRMKLNIAVSDPTQKAASARFSMRFESKQLQLVQGTRDGVVEFNVELPRGSSAGSPVHRDLILQRK